MYIILNSFDLFWLIFFGKSVYTACFLFSRNFTSFNGFRFWRFVLTQPTMYCNLKSCSPPDLSLPLLVPLWISSDSSVCSLCNFWLHLCLFVAHLLQYACSLPATLWILLKLSSSVLDIFLRFIGLCKMGLLKEEIYVLVWTVKFCSPPSQWLCWSWVGSCTSLIIFLTLLFWVIQV